MPKPRIMLVPFALVPLALVPLALAGCGRAAAPPAAVPVPVAGPAADALAAALAALPAAERHEAADATAIEAPVPAPAPAALTALRAAVARAGVRLGVAPAFRDDGELVPYLASLAAAAPPAAYDRAGFLAGLGVAAPRSPGKADGPTFAAVRAIAGYTPGTWYGGEEVRAQALAWGVARRFPATYQRLARAVNPLLEAPGRLRKPWAKPFTPRQAARPTGEAAAARYAAPARARAPFRLLFDPDMHSGLPGTTPPGRRPYGSAAVARRLGFPEAVAAAVATACDAVDADGGVALPYPKTGPYPLQGLDRHFNLDRKGQDTRLVWAARHLAAAIAFGRATSWAEAELELGVGLHSLQDAFAHGQLTPYLHGTIGEYPDDVRYDPVGWLEAEAASEAYVRAYLAGVGAP